MAVPCKLFKISILSTTILTLGLADAFLVASQAQTSYSELRFVCAQVDGTPATIATARRGDVVIIKWTKTIEANNPQARCEKVSKQLQNHYDNRTLRFIIGNRLNRQNVICIAHDRKGSCLEDGLLFTLRPDDDAGQFLLNLLQQSYFAIYRSFGANCVPKRNFMDKAEIALDFSEFLYQCPDSEDATP